MGVAASAFDELVVADYGTRRLRVFSSTGDLLATVGVGCGFTLAGVVVHGSTVLAADGHESVVSAFV
jgi:hypothetical protein